MKLLIHKYLEGKANEQEQKELLAWLRTDDNLTSFSTIKLGWEQNRVNQSIPAEHLSGWANIQFKLLQESQRNLDRSVRKQQFLRYAVLFFLLIAIPSVWSYFRAGQQKSIELVFNTKVMSEPGQIARIILPDSSEVWLNSGSSIVYNYRFATDNRELTLEGEAYFKAAKNPELPMIVNCSDLKIKVLGTHFNVNSYVGSKSISVVLEEGKVGISNTGQEKVQEINPGEIATYSRENKQIQINKVNTTSYTSWKEGIINIYNLSLEELVIRLERRYNQKFIIENNAKSQRYTFSIKNESLNQVLELMKTITPVDPVQKDNVIYLRFNKQRALKMIQK